MYLPWKARGPFPGRTDLPLEKANGRKAYFAAAACRKTPGGSGAAMQFAKVALRRPVGPSWRSLAHWASASLLPPLAALGFAPTEAIIGFGGVYGKSAKSLA